MNPRIAGLISGAAATVPMTAFMVATHKLLPAEDQQPLPPREITMHAAEKAGVAEHVDVPGRKTEATLTAHFGFGASAGALYSTVAGTTGLPPVAEGALYGFGVWAVNYMGLMPGLGLSRHAKDDTAGRNAIMIAANVLWGVVNSAVYSRLRRDEHADDSPYGQQRG